MAKTVTIRMRGGLGNQLFQYAEARSLAINNKAELELDCRDLILKNEQSFELKNFNLISHVKILDKGKPPSYGWRIYKKACRELYSELFFNYNNSFVSLNAPIYLEGYFQSEKYFYQNEKQIRKDISPNIDFEPKIKQQVEMLVPKSKSVSLHIRRGDYTNNKNLKIHGILSMNYYKHALVFL